MISTQQQTEQSPRAGQDNAVSVWLRSLMKNRRVLCGVGGTLMALAYATLNSPSLSIIHAAQMGSPGNEESGIEIVPRSARVNIGSAPANRFEYQSAPPEAQHGTPAEAPVSNRATLQRPILSQTAAPEFTREPVQQEPNYIYSSAHRSISYSQQEQYQTDGAPQVPGQWPQSSPTYRNPVGPGSVPPVPNGFSPGLPIAPPAHPQTFQPQPLPLQQFQPQPLQPIQDPSMHAGTPQPLGPSAHAGISAPQPGIQNMNSQPGHFEVGAGYAPGTSGFRATVESDAPPWMAPYYGRTGQMPQGNENSPTPAPSVVLPADFVAWWDPLVRQSAGLAKDTRPVEVSTLVQLALQHAPQVQVLQADPEVKYTIAHQEEAAFDWRAYLESNYNELNDPVGNTLTTGNNDNRFRDNKIYSEGGLKRRTETGGELQIGQSLGHQYNNSRFLLPNPQATSRLELSFRQPLMSQAGTVYNQSQIVLANINANVTSDESLLELQKHLYSVAEVYWNLYQARAEFFQRQKLLASSQQVLITLEGRNQVDTIPRQILRARAAVARAESRMQRAVTDIRNAESRLRLLVNDPAMLEGGAVEFTPSESPVAIPSPAGLKETLETALVNRPDISRAIREMRASSVRIGVSKSELLPRLDFLVTSYVAGLQNRTQIADSIGNQFTDGRPGFSVGFEFEVPLGRRAAKAKMEQRQWELKRAISAFRVTVETSLTEVEIANREVDTAYREMLGKYQAMIAAQNEVAYLQDRFNILPRIEDSSMLLLEDLLNGYERLADEESAFVQTQTNYALSIIQLRRSMGTLMRSRHDAPQLDAEYSDWMTQRADQTADETVAKQPPTIGITEVSATTPDVNWHATEWTQPAAWSQPVGVSPAVRSTIGRSSNSDLQAPEVPVRPATFGGHSFGTR